MEFEDRLVHDEHKAMYRYWMSKRPAPDRLPARRDIDPLDFPAALPRVALIDVLDEAGGVHFVYRLAGTEIAERAGRDPTGKRFDDLYGGEYLDAALTLYREIAAKGEPHLSERVFPRIEGREFLRYDRMILPLAADGATVDMLLLVISALQSLRDDGDGTLRPVR